MPQAVTGHQYTKWFKKWQGKRSTDDMGSADRDTKESPTELAARSPMGDARLGRVSAPHPWERKLSQLFDICKTLCICSFLLGFL